jgi:polyribonucleotide nucleotidyltransferase
MVHQVSITINGQELVLETGRMAKQANGAVFARYAGSAVIATVCTAGKEGDFDYLPLSVEYNEKFYAAGKIPGGFMKRESKPSSKEVLISRLIDRPMRPLFPKKFRRDIQIVPTTISADQVNPPDVIAMIASATAVHISDIPFAGPVGAVRVVYVDGQYVINPTFEQIQQSSLDIVVAGTEQGITMVEGGAKEVDEEMMINAIEEGHAMIKKLCEIQKELAKLAGKKKIVVDASEEALPEIFTEISGWLRPKLEQACFVKGKMERQDALRGVFEEASEMFKERIPEDHAKVLPKIFEEIESDIVRRSILDKKVRTDGRAPDQIRPITCEIDVLDRTHGSALFTRGETQALVVTTLGTVYDEKIQDDIDGDSRETFMLHYNFPPFSVGETGRLATGRREIGHGHLALRALDAMLPKKEEFPYTIRVVSEILESNGSSSMATVCGGTLSLLNCGVPMKKSVAGIAMGLVTDGSNFVVLSDILGEEDHLGDMDFKVAGTKNGITAFQMDIKIDSIGRSILEVALRQAKEGRLKILDIMDRTISEPREKISEFAPKIIVIKINPEKIGLVIGPGGKNIRSISEKYDSTINIENDGSVTIYCKNSAGADATKAHIESMVEEPEVGRVYQGKVKRIMDFGAFVEFLPGKEGLCHISHLSREHVNSVRDVLTEEQEIPVKLMEIDKLGRMNLSYIDAIDPDNAAPPRERNDHDRPYSRPHRQDGGRDRDRDRDRRRPR